MDYGYTKTQMGWLYHQVDAASSRASERYNNWTHYADEQADPRYLEGMADGLGVALNIIEAFIAKLPRTELEQRLDEFTLDEQW